MEFKFGSIVESKAGHDKGEIFVILRADTEYIYLVDGLNRTLDNPKKKNIKHVQVVHCEDMTLLEKQQGNLVNEDLKRAIKLYKRSKIVTNK